MCVAEQKRELLIPTSGGARLRGQTVPLLGVTAHLGPRSRAELSRWAAAALAMAGELEGCKPLSGLLSGLAQNAFHGNSSITEELLHSQLYPEVPPEEFRPFLAKMRGILKSIASADMDFNQLEAFLTAQTKKQGGITGEQAAVISKFWKSHKTRIRESLLNQSRWDNGLRGLSWRVDGKSQSRHAAQIHTPAAIVELEFGKSGQESEFLCLEFDEVKVKQVLKRLSEVEESISTLMQAA